MIKTGILTASDKGFAGERTDESSKVIATLLATINAEVDEYVLVPDEREIISANLIRMTDQLQLDLILTTGGTGFFLRDITPEATMDVIERQVPGIVEAMRAKGWQIWQESLQ